MITLYAITLAIYRDDLSDIIRAYTDKETLVEVLVETDQRWSLSSPHVSMAGSFKGKRLRILHVDAKDKIGVTVIKSVAALCKGTIIGVVEPDSEVIYVTKGQETEVALMELRKVR